MEVVLDIPWFFLWSTARTIMWGNVEWSPFSPRGIGTGKAARDACGLLSCDGLSQPCKVLDFSVEASYTDRAGFDVGVKRGSSNTIPSPCIS